MLFNSIEFLVFLPIVFLCYWFVFKSLRAQNLFVVIASYLFYGWWDWRFLLLNVKLIFITIPWYKTALETVTEEGKKEMYAIVDTIKTVNPDITYLDLLCDENFNEDDFCNATHLGAEGAKKLSNILVSYCQ